MFLLSNIVVNVAANTCVNYLYQILYEHIAFQCPYPVTPANRTLHIFCHFARKTEPDIHQYLWKYITHRTAYVAKVGRHHLKINSMLVDKYKEYILKPDTPLDLLGIFLLARIYRIHVGLILKNGLWLTSCVHDIRLCKFVLIYRGPQEYSVCCTTGNSNLYVDSLILNTKHGNMPCHADISKFQPDDKDHREFIEQLKKQSNVAANDKLHMNCIVDLSMNNAVKCNLKTELQTEQKFAVTMAKPKNVTMRNYS